MLRSARLRPSTRCVKKLPPGRKHARDLGRVERRVSVEDKVERPIRESQIRTAASAEPLARRSERAISSHDHGACLHRGSTTRDLASRLAAAAHVDSVAASDVYKIDLHECGLSRQAARDALLR